MLRFDVRGSIKDIEAHLSATTARHIPFATALALTRTAKFAEKQIDAEIPRVFDRPTPFTRSAVYTIPATKQRLYATVKVKDHASKAIPAIDWLAPQIYGGGRGVKRFEALLRSRGILGSNQYVVPAVAAKRDSYGNVSRGQLQQILSQVGASRDALQNRTARSKQRNRRGRQFFALSRPHGKLKPGIYERFGFAFGSAVRPVFIFVSQPRYRVRLRFHEIADQSSQMRFKIEFALAMRQALASSYNFAPGMSHAQRSAIGSAVFAGV